MDRTRNDIIKIAPTMTGRYKDIKHSYLSVISLITKTPYLRMQWEAIASNITALKVK